MNLSYDVVFAASLVVVAALSVWGRFRGASWRELLRSQVLLLGIAGGTGALVFVPGALGLAVASVILVPAVVASARASRGSIEPGGHQERLGAGDGAVSPGEDLLRAQDAGDIKTGVMARSRWGRIWPVMIPTASLAWMAATQGSWTLGALTVPLAAFSLWAVNKSPFGGSRAEEVDGVLEASRSDASTIGAPGDSEERA